MLRIGSLGFVSEAAASEASNGNVGIPDDPNLESAVPSALLWEGVARLARVTDRSAVLDTILHLLEGVGVAGPHILLHHPRSGSLELSSHRGVPWNLASRMAEPADWNLAPFVAFREARSPPSRALGPLTSLPLPCGMCHQAAALWGDGRLLGVLGWLRGSSTEEAPPGLDRLGSIFAAALLRVLRGAHQRKQSSQRDAVRRAALVVGEARDLHSVLRAIGDRARLLSGAELAAVRRCGSIGPASAEWFVSGREASAAGFPPERWPHAVPIRFQGRQLGEIRLWASPGEERPTDDDLQLTSLLAGHVAALLDAASAKNQLLLEVAERRRMESWLATVLEHSPVPTLRLSPSYEGAMASCNRRAKELLGVEAEGPLVRLLPLLRAKGGEPFSDEDNPLAMALRGERIQMLEAQVHPSHGEPIPVMVHGEPIPAFEGRLAGAVIALENISTFKTLERMREQWTSLVTHDLRQPITSILGFSSLLAEHPGLPESLLGKVKHIRSAARRLARLSGDLFDASRMEANRLTLEKRWVDVRILAEELVDEISRGEGGKFIRVVVAEEVPHVEIDPIRLEQVLENLLSNARKYGRAGSEILLRIEKGEGEVLLHVENEGDGLDPEELGKMFTRFFRGSEARDSDKPGMGLGLYISKGLIDAHGGRIWATSIRGKAVVFSVALPLTGKST